LVDTLGFSALMLLSAATHCDTFVEMRRRTAVEKKSFMVILENM